MNPRKKLNQKRIRRGKRIGMALRGTTDRPRLAVRRSNRYFYVEKGIKAVVFDRSSYKFHGRVKQFAEGAKKAGLIF